MNTLVHTCTVLGGLPVIAEVTYTKDYWGEYDSEARIFWQKKNGTKGAEFSEAMYHRLDEKDEDWLASVSEQVSEQCYYEKQLEMRKQ